MIWYDSFGMQLFDLRQMQGVAGEENSLSVILIDSLGLPWQGTAEGITATISSTPAAANLTSGADYQNHLTGQIQN